MLRARLVPRAFHVPYLPSYAVTPCVSLISPKGIGLNSGPSMLRAVMTNIEMFVAGTLMMVTEDSYDDSKSCVAPAIRPWS
jgi:hypothetical protein